MFPRYRSSPYPHPRERGEKETKWPLVICLILTVVVLITLVIGLILKNPYWVIGGMIPAAIYEAWRTEGFFTKINSVGIVVLLVFLILLLRGIVKIDLAGLFEGQTDYTYIAGYYIPFGKITFIVAGLILAASVSLLWRTFGTYTKWLSILLLISSIGLIYLINKGGLVDVLRYQI